MELSQETVKKLRGLVIFTVIVAVIGMNYRVVLGVFGKLFGMIVPFLLGGGIAFILNVPMRWMEKQINRKKEYRFSRVVSLAFAIAVVFGVLMIVTVVVGPELLRTLVGLQSSLPVFLGEIEEKLGRLFAENPNMLVYFETVQVDWEKMMQELIGFLSTGAGSVLSTTFSAVQSIANGVTSLGIGFVFAMYILLQKETLRRQCGTLLDAFLPKSASAWIKKVATLTERTFSSFLTGQCVEAVILGSMFFVTLSLLKMPYALLIGVLIAFTALIPIFGAFIGCVVSTFLILMVSPMQALIFVAVFFVLQQIEGNLIYPHVVGGSVGLPSIWVLVAVTLGGSMMGLLGMLVFIPLVSVLYALLREEMYRRLNQ